MIDNNSAYTSDNTMRELIRTNSSLLMVLSRFNIPLGFGDKTVGDICTENHVDTSTFLTVANYISHRPATSECIDISALTGYLRRAHSSFLDFILPDIRRKLLSSIDCSGSDDLAFVIIKFFDEYVREVRVHMEYENETVFNYIDSLINGTLKTEFSIREFAAQHKRMESKLMELKDILIRYCPSNNHDMLNSVLFDIINCEHDLASHCSVEDHLLVPKVLELEKELVQKKAETKSEEERLKTNGHESVAQSQPINLSTREQEIVRLIALGLSNKEIADRLCISVHTATTHRRNIVAKLDIHSPAGLTIYAIANHLVDIDDIKIIIKGF